MTRKTNHTCAYSVHLDGSARSYLCFINYYSLLIKPPSGHPLQHPEYIECALREFKSQHWERKSFAGLIRWYKDAIHTVPAYAVELRKGMVLYRGRINDRITECNYNQLKELGLKPATLEDHFGRGSPPGKSLKTWCWLRRSLMKRPWQPSPSFGLLVP
jgi:hypothetical protein